MVEIMKGYKLVPVELTEEMREAAMAADAWAFSEGQNQWKPGEEWIWEQLLAAAPTPPQPIYDEAKELEAFSTHWKLEGRIYRDNNTKQWLPTRDSIEGFQMAERVHALWLGWESSAKAGEVGHE